LLTLSDLQMKTSLGSAWITGLQFLGPTCGLMFWRTWLRPEAFDQARQQARAAAKQAPKVKPKKFDKSPW